MTGTWRRTRARARATSTAAGVLVVALLLPSAACRRDRRRDQTQVRTVDLIFHFKDAERRPEQGTFEIREHTFAGRSRASLIVPAASRVTWKLFIPHRARLHVYAGVPESDGPAAVAVRMGVSDERRYETLCEQIVTSGESAAGWVPVSADLSFYAGRKFSLFFRPDERTWNVVIGTHAVQGSPGFVAIGEPGMDTDVESAREYRQRLVDAASGR
jgi:hypothetical protein